MNRIIAIGDVHGELKKLKRLIFKIQPKKDDTIIFLGDYIDRGYDSCGVIDFIIGLKKHFNVICLKGNHEGFVTAYLNDKSDANIIMGWMQNGGKQTLNSYAMHNKDFEKDHADFFKSLKCTHETDTHIFVHGYLDHKLDVKDQSEFNCLWQRYEDIRPHKSGKIVVCGHTIHYGFQDDGYKICIDTGSFLKDIGFITAMIIENKITTFKHSD